MEKILQDDAKIQIYAQIQKNICDLEVNSSEESITNLINQIPSELFDQKDDLKIICELFSNYGRIRPHKHKGNVIKLFEKIMKSIKTQLQGESNFFWSIFGGIHYFKYWMYEEGLITIDHIIHSVKNYTNSSVIYFFLPEIIENKPELYEKEIKNKLKEVCSNEWINEFKELRRKHFKWLRESSNFHDPIYREIEKDPLRYSIKTDNVESFQKILSNSNLSINSEISESILETFFIYPTELPLLKYVIEMNAFKIFKFLIINDAKLSPQLIQSAVGCDNYEIVHIIESKLPDDFSDASLYSSIAHWSCELTEYALNNYDYEYLEKSDVELNEDKKTILFEIIGQTFFHLNFIFLKTTLLPFFQKNPLFVRENIYEILKKTTNEMSCFFMKEFLKFPGIDINHHYEKDDNFTLLNYSVKNNNTKAVEVLFDFPGIDVNNPGFKEHSSFQYVCVAFTNMEIIKLFCKNPNFDIYYRDPRFGVSSFMLAVNKGNIYVIKYLIDHFKNLYDNDINGFIILCLMQRNLFTLKIILEDYIKKNADIDYESIKYNFVKRYQFDNNYRVEFLDEIQQIFDEIKK